MRTLRSLTWQRTYRPVSVTWPSDLPWQPPILRWCLTASASANFGSINFARQVEEIVAARDRASRCTRWMYWGGATRDGDVQTRSRLAAEARLVWIPAAFMLSVAAVALINSAVTEFRR